MAFGPRQTIWKRHRRFSADGTWDRIHARLLAEADAAGELDWDVSVDSTINRTHQHATNLARGLCHRGSYRTTRIRAVSHPIMRSGVHAVA